MAGLNVSDVVRVSVNLSPLAAARRNFGVLCIAGPSTVIDPDERLRSYSDISGVAEDFGVDAPEYLAAVPYFAQSPRPSLLQIARWLKDASPAILRGGILSSAQQLITLWTAVTNGGFSVEIDGSEVNVTALNLGPGGVNVTNLNGVATAITAALGGAGVATCSWDGEKFSITCHSTGITSAIGFLTSPAGGTDISAMLKGTAATAIGIVDGADAEEPEACAVALADKSQDWYGLMFAPAAAVDITAEQHLAVSAFIEACSTSRIYGVTISDPNILSGVVTDDLASQAQAAGDTRTFCLFCSSNPYAVASMFGRAFTVDFNANKSTITLKFKQLPGVVYETLTETEATVLQAKRCNVFVLYNNDTAILQEGVMAGPAFFDEVHNLDWLQNAVQTDCYNLLYTSPTKIPQTDEGVAMIVNVVDKNMQQAVFNGLCAPGTWLSSAVFGELKTGDFLTRGYYIYATPLVLQSQADREARKAPPIQVACKLAGAVHSIDVIIDVNR